MTVATRLRVGRVLVAPDQLASLALRVRADTIVGSDGDAIASWADSSGNSRNLTQATAGVKPTFKTGVFNGHHAVRFDGAGDFLQTAAFGAALTQPNTLIFVVSVIAYGPGGFLCDGLATGRHYCFIDNVGGLSVGTSGSYVPGGTLATMTPMVCSIVYNGASSSFRRNGIELGNGDPGSQSLDGLTIGSSYAGGASANLDITEIAAFNPSPTLSELRAVERYLGAIYGVAVP